MKMRHLIFINNVFSDGLGDFGHLVDIVRPEYLSKTLQTHQLQPIYIIFCQAKTNVINYIIDGLCENGILSSESPIEAFNDTINLEIYLQKINDTHPHLHIITYINKKQGEACDFNQYLQTNAHLKQQLNTAAAILHISTRTEKLAAITTLPAMEFFLGEHDASARINLSITPRCMGFNEGQFGLLLQNHETLHLREKARLLIQLQNKNFLTDLIGQSNVSEEEAENFLRQNLFIPGYMQNKGAATIFITSIAASIPAKTYKNVVFYLNSDTFFISSLIKLLRSHGYSEIHIKRSGNDAIIHKLNKNASIESKIVKIYANYWLSNKDYASLYRIAQLFGGCSGDKSLEMVLSNNLVPFYETRPWKLFFASSFKQLANRYTNNNAVLNFITFLTLLEIKSKSEYSVAELTNQMAECINHPDFFTHWSSLIKQIQSKHNFYDHVYLFIAESIYFNDLYLAITTKQNDTAMKLLDASKTIDGIYNLYLCARLKNTDNILAFIYLKRQTLLDSKIDFNEKLALTFLVYQYQHNDIQHHPHFKPELSKEACINEIQKQFFTSVETMLSKYHLIHHFLSKKPTELSYYSIFAENTLLFSEELSSENCYQELNDIIHAIKITDIDFTTALVRTQRIFEIILNSTENSAIGKYLSEALYSSYTFKATRVYFDLPNEIPSGDALLKQLSVKILGLSTNPKNYASN